MRTASFAVTTALLLIALGCDWVGARISRKYVEADRKTYRFVAEDYRRRVLADPAVSKEDKEITDKGVERWDARIAEEESSWKQ